MRTAYDKIMAIKKRWEEKIPGNSVFLLTSLPFIYIYKHTPRIKIIEELKIHNITRMGHSRVQRLIDTCIYEILKSISQNKSLHNLSDTHVRNVGSTDFTQSSYTFQLFNLNCGQDHTSYYNTL